MHGCRILTAIHFLTFYRTIGAGLFRGIEKAAFGKEA
jgi:hypothetical protein